MVKFKGKKARKFLPEFGCAAHGGKTDQTNRERVLPLHIVGGERRVKQEGEPLPLAGCKENRENFPNKSR